MDLCNRHYKTKFNIFISGNICQCGVNPNKLAHQSVSRFANPFCGRTGGYYKNSLNSSSRTGENFQYALSNTYRDQPKFRRPPSPPRSLQTTSFQTWRRTREAKEFDLYKKRPVIPPPSIFCDHARHKLGLCVPCFYASKGGGCRRGEDSCRYCHICSSSRARGVDKHARSDNHFKRKSDLFWDPDQLPAGQDQPPTEDEIMAFVLWERENVANESERVENTVKGITTVVEALLRKLEESRNMIFN